MQTEFVRKPLVRAFSNRIKGVAGKILHKVRISGAARQGEAAGQRASYQQNVPVKTITNHKARRPRLKQQTLVVVAAPAAAAVRLPDEIIVMYAVVVVAVV